MTNTAQTPQEIRRETLGNIAYICSRMAHNALDGDDEILFSLNNRLQKEMRDLKTIR